MTLPELVKCAEALQRPCIYLKAASSAESVKGHWGGSRSDLPATFPKAVTKFYSRRHILSFDFDLIENLGFKLRYPFALAVWTKAEGGDIARAENLKDDAGKVSFKGAVQLAAHQAFSFPPLEAVCLYGGHRVAEWLQQSGLERWEYGKVDSQLQSEYQIVFQQRCPLYADASVIAQLGGWHVMWPDDEYYAPLEMRLLCWTFKNSEPWYEVFLSPRGNIVVNERIT